MLLIIRCIPGIALAQNYISMQNCTGKDYFIEDNTIYLGDKKFPNKCPATHITTQRKKEDGNIIKAKVKYHFVDDSIHVQYLENLRTDINNFLDTLPIKNTISIKDYEESLKIYLNSQMQGTGIEITQVEISKSNRNFLITWTRHE